MKENTKSNIATGFSTAAGAAVGVVAGNVLATEVDAADIVDGIESIVSDIEDGISEVIDNTEEYINNLSEENVAEDTDGNRSNFYYVSDDEYNDDVVVIEENEDIESEVEVIGYATVQVDEQSQMDVSVVEVDGQEVIIADVDMDGIADVAATDLNGNGDLDEGEMISLQDDVIYMDEMKRSAMNNQTFFDESSLLADVEEDYVNDADVDDFLA